MQRAHLSASGLRSGIIALYSSSNSTAGSPPPCQTLRPEPPSPFRTTLRLTEDPGAIDAIFLASSREFLSGAPSSATAKVLPKGCTPPARSWAARAF
jgi:hypothetical protein